MDLEVVKSFARENGYYTAKDGGKFHGMDAFIPLFRSEKMITGYNYLILLDGGKLRFSNITETEEYMGLIPPTK